MSDKTKITVAIGSLVASELSWTLLDEFPWVTGIFVCLSIIMFLGAIMDDRG